MEEGQQEQQSRSQTEGQQEQQRRSQTLGGGLTSLQDIGGNLIGKYLGVVIRVWFLQTGGRYSMYMYATHCKLRVSNMKVRFRRVYIHILTVPEKPASNQPGLFIN